jgi:hypothetical protein
METKLLIECWEYYRGAHAGYLLTAKEAWGLLKEYLNSPYRHNIHPYDAIIDIAHESQYCKIHDC